MKSIKIVCILVISFIVVHQAFCPNYGAQSMVKPLHKVIVKRPDQAFAAKDSVRLHYTSGPDLTKAQEEHDAFTQILKNEGVEVIYHETNLPDHADAIFVQDPVMITDRGAIMLRMGKPLRRGEEEALARCCEKNRVPVLFRLHDHATAEGGDILWLDSKTVAIGRSFRTNDEGINQLSNILKLMGIEVIVVELPYFHGHDVCLRLQSLISLVDEKLAVVYLPLLPVSFFHYLKKHGFTLIEVPEKEFMTMGTNILTIKPRVCVMLGGNSITKKHLEDHGVKVYTYKGDEISHKAEGGATYLTRPILRK